jgi:hypothetical protein
MTYADWSVSAKNPASFTARREFLEVARKARREGCLFARKIFRSSSSSSLVRDGKDGKSSQGVFMSRGGARSRKNNNNHGDESNDDDDGLISVEAWKRAIVEAKPS